MLRRLLRRDLASGTDVDLVSLTSGIARLALSPDGQWLAFTARTVEEQPVALVNIVPTAGGSARQIYRSPDG